jgi:hypothetical protein
MVGMLQAIQKTPLHERLQREGRLVETDDNCNIVPAGRSRRQATTSSPLGCTLIRDPLPGL